MFTRMTSGQAMKQKTATRILAQKPSGVFSQQKASRMLMTNSTKPMVK